MEKSAFDEILKVCPRFRILTSGKSGVGKTTLIKETFNIDGLKASDKDPGRCDIEDEIFSSQNDRFVLHDSQGFEPGEVDNFNKVKKFVVSRTSMPQIKDRLHAVWLCIQIPHVDGRLIETGDEEFLKLPLGDVPVVIIFTQYDRLYDQFTYNLAKSSAEFISKSPEERHQLVNEECEKFFEDRCVNQLKKIPDLPKRLKWVWVSNQKDYKHTLTNLVAVTEELVRNHVQESAWIVMASAQRVNADTNVKSCIAVGMQKYWRGLAAGTYFADHRLSACISVIHKEIVKIWNFRDEDQILSSSSFQATVLLLVQDLADADGSKLGSDVTKNLDSIKSALDVATPIAGPIAPVVASIGLSVMFVKWLSEMYNSTPGVLRCLMGYIVDITIVLEVLFWLKISQPRLPSLIEEDIAAAFGLYQGTKEHREVHRQIRHYVDNMTLLDQVRPDDRTHLEVERLINEHRRILVDTIFVAARETKPEPPPQPQAPDSRPSPSPGPSQARRGSPVRPGSDRRSSTSSRGKVKAWFNSLGKVFKGKKSGRKSP